MVYFLALIGDGAACNHMMSFELDSRPLKPRNVLDTK